MKIINLLGTICLACTYPLRSEAPFQPYWPHPHYQSQTYMFTRPIFASISSWQALWHRLSHGASCIHGLALQCMTMYQRAETTGTHASYWLCHSKDTLLFAGDTHNNDYNTRDVRAEWFHLPGTFRGLMTVSPAQSQVGILLELYKDMRSLPFKHHLHDCWLSIELAISHVENEMRLHQWNIEHPNSEFPRDIAEAFCNPEWNFLKVCGHKKKVQLAYINCRFGKNFCDRRIGRFTFYAGCTMPTSRKQDPAYMFSPIAGYDGHFGMIAGAHSNVFLSNPDKYFVICFFSNLEGILLAHNHQKRTFDLVCNPWSRYLLYVQRDSPSHRYIPGVNVLTRQVRVHPFLYADFACGFRLVLETFEGEIGYGIWGHGDEKIELIRDSTCPEEGKFGIAGRAPEDYGRAVTASASTIRYRAPYDRDALGNPIFIPITDNQLDLLSACSRSALNHKIFVSIGSTSAQSLGYTYGIGAYIEIPQRNTSLRSWGVWTKGGFAF